jgi:hypothetical protein
MTKAIFPDALHFTLISLLNPFAAFDCFVLTVCGFGFFPIAAQLQEGHTSDLPIFARAPSSSTFSFLASPAAKMRPAGLTNTPTSGFGGGPPPTTSIAVPSALSSEPPV